MKIINAANLNYRAVNEALCNADKDCMIESCCGQRFIAAGMSDKNITINGNTPKNMSATLAIPIPNIVSNFAFFPFSSKYSIFFP